MIKKIKTALLIPLLFFIVYITITIFTGTIIKQPVWSTIATDCLIIVVGLIFIRKSNFRCLGLNTSGFDLLTLFIALLGTWLVSQIVWITMYKNSGDTAFVEYNQQITSAGTIAYLILTLIIAPVAEEIMFRGILFNALNGVCPIWISAIITSILFSASHGTLIHLVSIFFIGMIFAIIYTKTGRLWISMIAHSIYNFFAVFASAEVFSPELFTPVGATVIGIFAAVGLILWVYKLDKKSGRKKNKLYKFNIRMRCL